MLKRFAHTRALTGACLALGLALAAPAFAQVTLRPDSVATPAPAAAPAKPARPRITREADRAANGPWAGGTNWMSLRAGYAKSSTASSGNGLGGYGLAYQRMINSRWGFEATVHHELLGHFDHAVEISVPMTAQFIRHIHWHSTVRPYVGIGGGYFFHKYYRTGSDYGGAPASGLCLSTGANLPVDDRHLLGLDIRLSVVDGRHGVSNPVFGEEPGNEMQWSAKLNWALAY